METPQQGTKTETKPIPENSRGEEGSLSTNDFGLPTFRWGQLGKGWGMLASFHIKKSQTPIHVLSTRWPGSFPKATCTPPRYTCFSETFVNEVQAGWVLRSIGGIFNAVGSID